MTAKKVPNSRPQMQQEDVMKVLATFGLQEYPVKLLGIRGYYKQTMGNPVENDIGVYDDAIFVISPHVFASFNANTDPSVTRPGIATLKPGGPYLYKIGKHGVSGKNPYKALRQHGRVTVVRAGKGEDTDTAAAPFYINIHRGGYKSTSSEGCQTIYPTQWDAFITLIEEQMKRNKQVIVPYALITMK